MRNTFQLLVLGLLCAGRVWAAEQPPAIPAPEWNALFERTNDWIGADGSYSVPISADTTVWLFSDTLVGGIRGGVRTNLTMINNSIAVQRGAARPEFFYRTNREGKPASFITPNTGTGFYWLFHGTRNRTGLHFFLHQTVILKPSEVFGFKLVDCWLAGVSNPDDPPPRWRVKQTHVPFTEITTNTALVFGAAVLRDAGFAYIYGCDSRPAAKEKPLSQGIVLARVPVDDFARFKRWEFFSDGGWQKDFRKVTLVATNIATEFSVTHVPALRRYVLIHMEALWGKMLARLAPAPEGPWSAPIEIYRCPEMQWPAKPFCYAAKAHPELPGRADELLITYAQNSFEFKYLVSEPRLYWPRFVRLPLRELGAATP
jgi:hypothetical protein